MDVTLIRGTSLPRGMNVPQITVEREQAQREYEAYRDALKTKKDAFLHDLKVAYGHMRHGRTVLDVWQAFADQGIDAKGMPKLAISRADWSEVWFVRSNDGDVDMFQADEHRWHSANYNPMTKGDVRLPAGTLPRLRNAQGVLTYERLRTKTPIIPARFMPDHALSNYHVLWEVEKWDVVTPPKDPMLLKRVSPNVFVVLAGWDLTPLERAVLRGRIA